MTQLHSHPAADSCFVLVGLSLTWRCWCCTVLQVAELKLTIEDIADGVHSARKPQRVGAPTARRCWLGLCCVYGVWCMCTLHATAALIAAALAPHCAGLQAFGNGGARGGEVTVNPVDLDGRYQSADYYTHTEQTKAFQAVR